MKTRLVCLVAFFVSALGSSVSVIAADFRSASFTGTTNVVPTLTAADLLTPNTLVLKAPAVSLLENVKLFTAPQINKSVLSLTAEPFTFTPVVDTAVVEQVKRTTTIDFTRFRVAEVPAPPTSIRLLAPRASFKF